MKNILESPLAIFFSDINVDDVAELNDLYTLEFNEAKEIWSSRFQSEVEQLSELPKNSWLYSTNWKVIGRWLEAYNEPGRFHEVLDLIRSKSGWSDETRLILLESKQSMLELSFFHFCKYWEELFCIFDDAPILMSKSIKSPVVFQFYPLGDIVTADIQF